MGSLRRGLGETEERGQKRKQNKTQMNQSYRRAPLTPKKATAATLYHLMPRHLRISPHPVVSKTHAPFLRRPPS